MRAPARLFDRRRIERIAATLTGKQRGTVAPDCGEDVRIIGRRYPQVARDILYKNAATTQAALDEYLAAVADPRILAPLRAARDGACGALRAFDTRDGAKP